MREYYVADVADVANLELQAQKSRLTAAFLEPITLSFR